MLWDILITIMITFTIVIAAMSFVICLPRKFSLAVTVAALIGWAVMILIINYFTGHITTLPLPPGWAYVPIVLFLFKGYTLQKIFLLCSQFFISFSVILFFSMSYGFFLPYGSPEIFILMMISVTLIFTGYIILMLKFGKQLLKSFFEGGNRGEWILYTTATLIAYILLFLLWRVHNQGNIYYFISLLFLMWSFIILCFAIINTHKKAANARYAETMALQAHALKTQVEEESKYRNDMNILRHDMRHSMGVIMELTNEGKTDKAKKVYSDWLVSHNKVVPVIFCDEPVINAVFSLFKRRARDRDLTLDIKSQLQETISIDTIKLSVVLSNALENAITAADLVKNIEKRVITVHLFNDETKLGIEILNPCETAVLFDDEGLPVTKKDRQSFGVQSIAAFARENKALLKFEYADDQFAMRMIIFNS